LSTPWGKEQNIYASSTPWVLHHCQPHGVQIITYASSTPWVVHHCQPHGGTEHNICNVNPMGFSLEQIILGTVIMRQPLGLALNVLNPGYFHTLAILAPNVVKRRAVQRIVGATFAISVTAEPETSEESAKINLPKYQQCGWMQITLLHLRLTDDFLHLLILIPLSCPQKL